MPFTKYETIIPSKKIRFEAHDIELAIVNGLRRVLIADIPNVAIAFDPYNENDHDVNMHSNTTNLNNEIISQRLSLIPICMHPNEIRNFEKMNYQFVINKKNNTNNSVVVTTDDFEILDVDGKPYPESLRRRLFPHDSITDEPIIIAKLKPNLFDKENGDSLHFDTRATKDTATRNSSWCPVSLCTFRPIIDDAKVKEAFEEEANGKTPEQRAVIKRRFDTLDRARYFKSDPHTNEPREVIMDLESECAMDPAFLVFTGLRILTKKVERFAAGLIGENDYMHWKDLGNGFFEMRMHHENDTLGNLIKSEFYSRFINTMSLTYEKGPAVLDYVGYNIPHPLEKVMLMKWKFTKESDLDRVRDWILIGSHSIIKDLIRLTHGWIKVSGLRVDDYLDIAEFVEENPASAK